MSYELIAIPQFKRDIKKLIKKYPSIEKEFSLLIDSISANPLQGISLGNNCYKIRMAIASKGKAQEN